MKVMLQTSISIATRLTALPGDQPAHLRVKPEHQGYDDYPSEVSIKKYAGPEQRFCPAGIPQFIASVIFVEPMLVGVYEYTEPDQDGTRRLVINAQNW